MANQEQLDILRQGVDVWNKWWWKCVHDESLLSFDDERSEDFFYDAYLTKVDLSGANLSKIYLRGIKLGGADLNNTDFSGADLSGASLNDAFLANANLSKTNLVRANLKDADLTNVNLSNADLSGADLSGTLLNQANLIESKLIQANLEDAKLQDARLNGANLRGANLTQVDLGLANLSGADLIDANLVDAILAGADLNEVHLKNADLTNADLVLANLNGVDLEGTYFRSARMGTTTITSADLSKSLGLETVLHQYPSSVSIDTIQLSKGKIPEVFLRGCGLADWEIESVKLYNPDINNEDISKIQYRIYDLRATQAIQVSPVFISYSHTDSAFVDKLEIGLKAKGIRFWRDIHNALAGRLETQIDLAIRQNPTVLLILSKNSMNSDWVQHEVRKARELEKELGRDALCPIALDDSWKSSRWPQRVMEQVMEYNILDFSKWEDESTFQVKFAKLLNGLDLFYKKPQ